MPQRRPKEPCRKFALPNKTEQQRHSPDSGSTRKNSEGWKLPSDDMMRKNKELHSTFSFQCQEIDMSGALIEQTSDLIGKVNFSTALGESFYSILVQRPTQTHKSDALLAPFDTTVWILILVSLALMGPLAFLLILFRAYICRGHPMLGKIFTLGDCVWFSYGALLKQGSVLRPMNDSARVIFMTWWLFITVICAFYTANLTAFLTLAKYELPIKSLADLESKPHYRWKAPKGSALQSLIENVNENSTFYGLSLTLDKNFKHFDETEDPRNMLDNVASENTVYLDSIDVLQYFIVSDYRRRRNEFNMSEEDSCRFRYAETEIENHLFSLAYPLGSNLTKLFDPYLSQMLRGGLVDHWRIKDVPDADICSLAKGFQERSLNLNDLYSTFLIIITGYCSGTFLFILENMRRCFCKKDPHRVSNLSALINKLSLKSVYSQYPRGIRSARDSARPRTRRLSQFHNNLAASRVSRLGTSTISNSVEPHGGPDWHLDYAYSEPLFSFTTGPKGERRQLHGAALSSAASRKLGGTLTSLRDPSAAASRKFAATFTNNSLSGTMTDMEFQREGVGQGKTNDAAPEIKTINGRQYTIVRVDGVVRAIPRK
ncbi:unnamed protein product [Cyprideis torosa]|uniref:Uncharacterized protein n=1 Tax=Cyprideis torosa TaxID=163714 RepID=A0A7R8W2W7_9CRUS|nr:unnamed protein product [Cyprideis torosa]CAG0879082.1 unnamed protein product [Cyprideis torosa]